MPSIRNKFTITPKWVDTIEGAAGLGTGNPNITQVTSRPLVGWQMDSATDVVTGGFPLPFYLDPAQKIGVTLHWTTGSSTAADSVTWVFTYELVYSDTAIGTAINDALDTTIAVDTVGDTTAYLLKTTSRGVINANKITRTQLESGCWIQYAVELNAVSGINLGSDFLWLLGITFDFVERSFEGGTGIDQGLTSEV